MTREDISMKLLFLSPYLPNPPRSGGPAGSIACSVSWLRRGHEVSLLAFTAPGEETDEALRQQGSTAPKW